MLEKLLETTTLRFDSVAKVRLDERPMVVDNDETEDCVKKKL
jgi:hypothetical protein